MTRLQSGKWVEIVTVVLVSISPAAMSARDRNSLGEVEFFSYKGFDLAAIRSALPFHEGKLFPPAKANHQKTLSEK